MVVDNGCCSWSLLKGFRSFVVGLVCICISPHGGEAPSRWTLKRSSSCRNRLFGPLVLCVCFLFLSIAGVGLAPAFSLAHRFRHILDSKIAVDSFFFRSLYGFLSLHLSLLLSISFLISYLSINSSHLVVILWVRLVLFILYLSRLLCL